MCIGYKIKERVLCISCYMYSILDACGHDYCFLMHLIITLMFCSVERNWLQGTC